MYTTIYVHDFPSRSSKLSSRSLRLGNKELLHTTQLQTALYAASQAGSRLPVTHLRARLQVTSLEPGDMYTTIYVYDFPSRSSKLSSRSLRVRNKEFQTALYTASESLPVESGEKWA